jgi:all-beta uncharacterized protein
MMAGRLSIVTGICVLGLVGCGGPRDQTASAPTTPSTPGAPTNASCSFAVESAVTAFDAAGGSASVTVSTGGGCRWTVDAGADTWIQPPAGGPFTGTVTFAITIGPNRSFTNRTGTLAIKDQHDATVAERALTQRSAGCLYSVEPTARVFEAIGTYFPGEPPAPVDVRVHAEPSDCRWTIASMPSWTELAWFSPSAGTGDGHIAVIIRPNTTSVRRVGEVVIAGLSGVNPDARLTVTQAGR